MGKEDQRIMQEYGQGSYQIDLREVFHLSHEQIPIEEIEDMELVPQIESREFGDQIEIVGSLILYGNYKGNQDAGKLHPADDLPDSYEESVLFEPLSTDRGPFSPLTKKDQLRHQIPVQITLPRNKVRDLDEVYTYVSSFDYELKTPYQIEVMASLVISGLVDKEEQMEKKESHQDEFEFIHVAGQNGQDLEDTYSERLQAFEEQASGQQDELEREEDQEEQMNTPYPDQPSDKNRIYESAEQVNQTEEEFSVEVEAVEQEREQELPEETDNVIPLPLLSEKERMDIYEETEEQPEQDIRVAITNNGTKRDQEPISSLSTFFSSRAPVQEELVEEHDQRFDDSTTVEDRNATYLTNFMESSEEQFTRVKICIIQKDETIDEIAERYNLTVDSILRSNGTARNQVTAGQLLYIPVKG